MVHMMSWVSAAVLAIGGFIGVTADSDGAHAEVHISYGWGSDCAIC